MDTTTNNRLDTFANQTSELENDITNMPDAPVDKNFLNILFQGDEHKKIAEAKLALVTTQLEYRRKALVMYSNLRIEELRKYCESEAIQGGFQINVRTEMYIRELAAEREVWANAEVDKFLENYELAVARMEKIKSPIAREKEQQRLNKTLEAFYETIEHFDEQFKRTLRFNPSDSDGKTS